MAGTRFCKRQGSRQAKDGSVRLCETFGARVARIGPMAEKTRAHVGSFPEQAAVFELGVLLVQDAVLGHALVACHEADVFCPFDMFQIARFGAFQFWREQIFGMRNKLWPRDSSQSTTCLPFFNSRRGMPGRTVEYFAVFEHPRQHDTVALQ